jgi:hypothetical protein
MATESTEEHGKNNCCTVSSLSPPGEVWGEWNEGPGIKQDEPGTRILCLVNNIFPCSSVGSVAID